MRLAIGEPQLDERRLKSSSILSASSCVMLDMIFARSEPRVLQL